MEKNRVPRQEDGFRVFSSGVLFAGCRRIYGVCLSSISQLGSIHLVVLYIHFLSLSLSLSYVVCFESEPPTATPRWILRHGLIVSTSTISIRPCGPGNKYLSRVLGIRESAGYKKRKIGNSTPVRSLTPDGSLDAAVTRNLYLRLPLPPIYI